MKKLYNEIDNIERYITTNFKEILNYELECPSCSDYCCFSFVTQYNVIKWDISIPYDWAYGDWENVQLRPIEVPIIILKCNTCNELYRMYPTFVVKGTTLTVAALAFIAFVYESSDLTWRAISDKFCDENDKIAHSTLFRSVHGLGQGILDDEEIQKKINELNDQHLNTSQDISFRNKSQLEHTKKREEIIRKILKLLLMAKSDCKIVHLFYIFLKQFKQILSNMDPPVKKIYTHNINILANKTI